jgi:hypothetical protein
MGQDRRCRDVRGKSAWLPTTEVGVAAQNRSRVSTAKNDSNERQIQPFELGRLAEPARRRAWRLLGHVLMDSNLPKGVAADQPACGEHQNSVIAAVGAD